MSIIWDLVLNVSWQKADQTVKLRKIQMTAVNTAKGRWRDSENANQVQSSQYNLWNATAMQNAWSHWEPIGLLCVCGQERHFHTSSPTSCASASLFSHSCCYSAELVCNLLSHWSVKYDRAYLRIACAASWPTHFTCKFNCLSCSTLRRLQQQTAVTNDRWTAI